MLRSKLGMSFGEISKELFNNTHIKVSRTTIMRWIKEDIEKKADEL
jgi:intein-encoded DNA endonuclease-like protein